MAYEVRIIFEVRFTMELGHENIQERVHVAKCLMNES